MSDKDKKTDAVTFLDKHYLERKIKVGNETLQVESGKVIARTEAQIAALRKDSALREVN